MQYRFNILDLVRMIICGMEENIQGAWSTTKAYKHLYLFFQMRNTTNDDYMKYF